MAYSPTFAALCRGQESGRYGFRKLGMLEIVTYAIGIKFPKDVRENSGHFFTDLKQMRDSQYIR